MTDIEGSEKDLTKVSPSVKATVMFVKQMWDQLMANMPDDPGADTKLSLTMMFSVAEKSMEYILNEGYMACSHEEYIPALTELEQIRDDTGFLIRDLENLGY